METKIYEKVKEFSETNKLTKLQEACILQKVYEDYTQFSTDAKVEELQGIESTVLNATSLSTDISLIQPIIDAEFQEKAKKIKRKQSWREFGMNIVASVVASILFTFILAIFITLAQNQLKSWVDSLYNNNQNIEQAIGKDKT